MRGFEVRDRSGEYSVGIAPGHIRALGAAVTPGLAIPIFASEREIQRVNRLAAEAEVSAILAGVDQLIDSLPNRTIATQAGTITVEALLEAQANDENTAELEAEAVLEAERLLRDAKPVALRA